MEELDAHPVPHSALLFMAMVEEARRSNEGPFRAIAPIFRVGLEGQRGAVLNVANAVKVLQPIFGPNFTHHSFEAFIPQLVSLGWLRPSPAGQGQEAYLVPSDLPTIDEQDLETSADKLLRLYEAFRQFLEDAAPLLKVTLERANFEWQLFRWATSLDGADKDAIKAHVERLQNGEATSAKAAYLDEPQKFSKIDRQLSVEFAAFTKWLAKHRRDELADLASLTELGLAMEFLEELRSPAQGVIETDTAFVLDAPVLLDLLGLSGPSRKESIESVLRVLTKHGGKIITLQHCLVEVSDIITSVLEREPHRRFGLTGDAIRGDQQLEAVARSIASQPDKAVKGIGIEVLHFDPASPLNEKFFPQDTIDLFRTRATWHDVYKTEQRERDAHSVAFVMRRRQGYAASDVLEARFVLVARNATFTSFSQGFTQRELRAPTYSFGPVIETKTLAAFVWMRFGSEASSELPQAHLIAACDRILASNGELLRKADEKLKKARGSEVALALLTSRQAMLDLVVSVGGSAEVLDAANGEELVAAMNRTAEERGRIVEREKAAKIAEALSAEITAKEAQIEERSKALAKLAAENLKQEGQISVAAKLLNQRDKADEERSIATATRLGSASRKSAWLWVNLVWCTLALVGALGQFFVWQGVDWWMKAPLNFLVGILVVLSTMLALVGALRFLRHGKTDPVAFLQSTVERRMLLASLRDIGPVEERDRVRDQLKALRYLVSE